MPTFRFSFPRCFTLSVLVVAVCTPRVQAAETPAWQEQEKGILENHLQLTSEEEFVKAGECYFSPDGRQIIFQAIEKQADPAAVDSFYQMYVADLVFEGDRITGIEKVMRLSPEGSSNTCGWFHPTEPGVVIFGSTLISPEKPEQAGYQRDSSRYVWKFPREMDIVRCDLAKADGTAASLERIVSDPGAYLAECVTSSDGKYLLYCEHQVAEGTSGGDLFVMDLETRRKVPVTGNKGYDGGPFFSPDGRRICYRSDRRGDDLLQVFVAELAVDHAGQILGVSREFQLTDNVHVNWAPYWHPSGRYLIYTTSEEGHDNYEVFVIDADAGTSASPSKYGTRRRRLTYAAKFDGLPVFDVDASRMMWTSQRGADGSSQVWLADFVMSLDRTEKSEETPAEPAGAKPEKLQVKDPESGLIYMYDPSSHILSVYDPSTHQVREPKDKTEIDKAMKLFRR